ncbi:CCCH zinc finger protein [Stagonosporopsis vannaccii]|nr:CCCH zinc finger protein [Stagonosporopsis vannaccii]
MADVPPPAPAPPPAVTALALVPPATPPPGPLTYRERLAQFRILEEKRLELIEVAKLNDQELLDKLEKTEARLAQTELDLNSEQNVRRTLQAEVHEAKTREEALAQKQAKRPFVLVLIDVDAEGFLFQDKYITRKAQGGEALADELLIRTREYLRPQFEDADSLDIIIRVYANLEGLAKYLVRQDKISNLGSLRAMSTSFSGRIASFDFVDVGIGKEGSSGRKIRENLSFFTSNSHLRHVIIGCSPVDLPAALLSTLPLDKVTLIESLPLPSTLTTPPLKTTKFSTIFPPPPMPKSPRPTGRNGPQLQLMQQEDDSGGQTWLVIQPERSDSRGHRDSKRRGRSEDEASNISISIGPDNSVSVDSGHSRRIMR